MTTQNATPAASPDTSIPNPEIDASAKRVDSVGEQRVEVLMRLADAYADEAGWAGYYSDSSDLKNEAIDKRDIARSALRAALASHPVAARVASEWMPIASAPKDMGSYLFLCSGVALQGFVDATGVLCVCQEAGGNRWRQMRRKPTHWQPLPAPTSQQPTQEGV